MKYTTVTDLVWANAANTTISCRVDFEGLGIVPFTAAAGDPEEHGRLIYARAIAGDFGAIAPYVAPPAEPEPVPDEISNRQFWQLCAIRSLITEAEAEAALGGTIPAAMQAMVDQLPPEQRFAARMHLKGSTVYRRSHSFTLAFGVFMGWTSAQIDQFWRDASVL